MGANINSADIYRFLETRRSPAYPNSQATFANYGNQPRWAPSLRASNLLEDDDESEDDANNAQYDYQYDDQLEYSTASTVTSETSTMPSGASRSGFSSRSSRHSRRNMTHITTPTEGPDNPPLTFVQQFHTPGTGPLRPGQILWCEFFGLLECPARFRLDEEAEWIQHHVEHLGNRFPRTLMCWFCDHVPFEVKDHRNAFANFEERMQHVRGHILDDHWTSEHTRRDLRLVTHLHDHGILNPDQFKVAMEYDETPDLYRLTGDHSYPPSSSSYQQPLGQAVRVEFHDLKKEERERRRQKQQQRPGRRR